MIKEEITPSVKKIINGLLASIGAAIIQILLFFVALNYFNLFSSILLLILVTLESLMLFIIYLSYKLIILEEYLLADTGKTRVFLKGLLSYIVLNSSLQITRAILLVVLSSNIIISIETVSSIIYTINLLATFTIAPLLVYVIIWISMLYIAVKEVDSEEEGKHVLTATATLMLVSIVSYLIYQIAGIIIMITALLTQAYLFFKISKKADTANRRKLKQQGKQINKKRVRKS